MTIRVINLHKATHDELTRAIYIGRENRKHKRAASPLANPYRLQGDMTREQAIRLYRVWLWERIKDKQSRAYRELVRIAGLVKAGEEVLLACYCAPKECHGDTVKAAIEWMLRKERAK